MRSFTAVDAPSFTRHGDNCGPCCPAKATPTSQSVVVHSAGMAHSSEHAGSTAFATTSLVRPLTRGPTATTVRVKELIEKVQQGEVRVPKFQRPLRWRQEDVLRLLDSIWRGYPVGSLLFWKRSADAERVLVGGAHVDAPPVSDAWWVVDGQQRTTALAASLLDLDHAGDPRWTVSFDPELHEFRAGPPLPDEEGKVVPVSVLGDLRRLGRWIREHELDGAFVDEVEKAQQRLLDYAIPAYVVDTDDEQALRGVFARLNSTGARMRADEVFQALLGAPSSTGAKSLDLDELQRGCDVDGFGQPARIDIFKSVLAMGGRDPTVRLDDRHVGSESLPLKEDAAEALSRTRDFLVRDCGIPWFGLLPYPVVFVILARWFYVHPQSADSTRGILARWVWRGAVTGAHQRAEVSRMREQVRDIQPDHEQASLDRLLARVETRPSGPWELRRFHLSNARSRIETLALLSRNPQDELGSVTIAELTSQEAGRVARELFQTSDTKGLPENERILARTVANRVVLGGRHWGLQRTIRDWHEPSAHPAERLQTMLASQVIDELGVQLLLNGKVGQFLQRRAESVRGVVERFTSERAAWGEPLIRPIEIYLDSEDG